MVFAEPRRLIVPEIIAGSRSTMNMVAARHCLQGARGKKTRQVQQGDEKTAAILGPDFCTPVICGAERMMPALKTLDVENCKCAPYLYIITFSVLFFMFSLLFASPPEVWRYFYDEQAVV